MDAMGGRDGRLGMTSAGIRVDRQSAGELRRLGMTSAEIGNQRESIVDTATPRHVFGRNRSCPQHTLRLPQCTMASMPSISPTSQPTPPPPPMAQSPSTLPQPTTSVPLLHSPSPQRNPAPTTTQSQSQSPHAALGRCFPLSPSLSHIL